MDAVRSIYGPLGQFDGTQVLNPRTSARPSKSSQKEFPDPVVFDKNGDDRLDALDVVYTNTAKRQIFTDASNEESTREVVFQSSSAPRPLPAAYAEPKEKPQPASDKVSNSDLETTASGPTKEALSSKPVLSLTV